MAGALRTEFRGHWGWGGLIRIREQGLVKLVGAGWMEGQERRSLWASPHYLLSSCSLSLCSFPLLGYDYEPLESAR